METVKIWISDTAQTDAMSPAQLKAHTRRLLDAGIKEECERGSDIGVVSYTDETGFTHTHKWKVTPNDDPREVDVQL